MLSCHQMRALTRCAGAPSAAVASRSFPWQSVRLATTFSLRRRLTPCVYTFLSDISPDRVRLTRGIAVLSECLQMSRENPPPSGWPHKAPRTSAPYQELAGQTAEVVEDAHRVWHADAESRSV